MTVFDARDLGKRIREIREHAKLSQEDLAFGEEMMSLKNIRKIERAVGINPTLETLCHIADRCGVHVRELFVPPGSPIPAWKDSRRSRESDACCEDAEGVVRKE